jgi:hypothetical protein
VHKACNEIALVNRKTGGVTYGIDSLLLIIGNSFPLFKPLFKLPAFHWVMNKLYAFISYNRKVIIPGKNFESKNSCTPSFSYRYRLVYIFITFLLTAFILNAYRGRLTGIIPPGNLYREIVICGTQIFFQGVVVYFLKRERVIHYLGNMMTISFAGSLLLLIALPLSGIIGSALFYAGWFLFVVLLMLVEHVRRVRLLEIHWSASLTWISYRFLVLMMLEIFS